MAETSLLPQSRAAVIHVRVRSEPRRKDALSLLSRKEGPGQPWRGRVRPALSWRQQQWAHAC